ncbi:AAA family ATPase [Sorangium sp. So ce693]|uniref:AAA family ATPase n=1 Tax=Sorangium sp. So ce693 TaxID=3133318 RepID=UPI003F625C4E
MDNVPKGARMPRLTLAVVNQKGGVGKTTLAVNLAAAAHLEGRRTLLLDLDAQGSALDWSATREASSRLDGLACAKADRALNLPRFRELTAGYDVAVLDGPPRLGDVTRSAALAADVVLVPLRPGAFDWWAAADTLALLDSADLARDEMQRPRARRLFVLNAVNERTRGGRAALEALRSVGELAPSIGARVAFSDAALAGESVLTTAPGGPAAAELLAVWRALAGRREATDG